MGKLTKICWTITEQYNQKYKYCLITRHGRDIDLGDLSHKNIDLQAEIEQNGLTESDNNFQ